MKRPLWVLIFFVLACAGIAERATHLPQKIGVESALGPHHQLIQDFHSFIERYGGGQPILLAWRCGANGNCPDSLSPPSLNMANEVLELLEPSIGIIRVTGPANALLLVGEPGSGFSQRRLVENGQVVSDHERLASHARTDPTWVGRWISADAQVGVMMVETASSRTEDLLAAVAAVHQATDQMRGAGFEVHAVGQPILEEALATGALRDGAVLSGAVAFILAGVIYGLLRTWTAVVSVLAAVGGGAAGAMGWMVAAGYPRDPISAAAPMLVMVIGSAVGLHLFSFYLDRRSQGQAREEAMRASTARLLIPCGLATFTTAGALLSYAFADLDALARLGIVAAFGIGVAFLLCFTLLPALVMVLPVEPEGARRSVARWEPHLHRLAKFAIRRAGTIVAGSVLLVGACVWAAGSVSSETDSVSYLYHAHPASVANRFVSHQVRPTQSLEVEVTLPSGRSLMEPGAFAALESIEQVLLDEPWLQRPESILQPARQLNRLLHDDEPSAYAIPKDARAAGELLMLLSLGDPAGVDALLTLDHRRARFSVPVDPGSHQAQSDDFVRLEQRLMRQSPPGWEIQLTGPLVLQRWQLNLTVSSMAQSLSLAVALVFVVLWGYLQSLRWALVALIPNLLPLLVLAGTMGAFGIPFDAASASVGTMAIGIAVDDTIHMLVALRRNRFLGSREACIDAAICEVGRPIIITSLAFGLGFLALLPSAFPGVANMGLLSSLAVFAALVADLLLLPALIQIMPGIGFVGAPDYLDAFDVPTALER